MHPALYKYTSKSGIDSVFESVTEEIKDSLSQSEFQCLIGKCLSSARCLHTRLALNNELFDDINSFGTYIPIKKVKVENNDLYVVATADTCFRTGDKIIAINGIPSSQIVKAGYEAISSDGYNMTFKRYAIEEFFFFVYYAYVQQANNFEIELLRNQTQIKVVLNGLKPKDFWNKYYSLNKVNTSPVWSSITDPGKTGYIKVNSFKPDDYLNAKLDYERSFKEIFSSLKKEEASNLIVDLRGCQGGSIHIPMELLTYLIHKQFIYSGETFVRQHLPEKLVKLVKKDTYFHFPECNNQDTSLTCIFFSKKKYKPKRLSFKGNVYFLVDGGTLSASGMLTSIIKHLSIGQIIGEETAGAFYTGAKGMEIRLPNSGVMIEVSYRTGQVILDGEKETGHGVLPDVTYRTTINDIIKGEDPALLFTKTLFKP